MKKEEKQKLNDILFGDEEERSVSELFEGVEKFRQAAVLQVTEINKLREDLRSRDIEVDRLTVQASAAKAAGSAKYDDILSQLRTFYGNDLTWSNIVELAGGAVTRLRSQAALMEAAETEMRHMRGQLNQIEYESGGIPDSGCCASGDDKCDGKHKALFEHRILRLEEDLAAFRFVGRAISRLFRLDSLLKKE